MARDRYHELVKQALIDEGWTITDDPLIVDVLVRDLEVDLGAERIIAAEKENEKIAVEIKNFLSISQLQDFYKALGQFNYYYLALKKKEPERTLYLAIPQGAYESFFQEPITLEAVAFYNLKLIVYSISRENITKWEK